jgi:acyl-homoserine lactone acylase PvdQ
VLRPRRQANARYANRAAENVPIVIVLPKVSVLKKLSLICSALTAVAGCAAAVSNSGRTITIKHDTHGVPHVYPNDGRGLFYGYGYVVAEDQWTVINAAARHWETLAFETRPKPTIRRLPS